MTDVSQGVAEVFIRSRSGGPAGGQGSRDGEGGERKSAFATAPGGKFVDGGDGGRGCGAGGCGGRGGDRKHGGRCHQSLHRCGRTGAVGCQGTQFQQDGAKVTVVVHAGVGQQFVDDPLVPG
jgi:hypothetical protein